MYRIYYTAIALLLDQGAMRQVTLWPVLEGDDMRSRRIIGFLVSASLVTACNPAERDWHKTTTANTAEAYQTFIQDHPNSEHVDEARGRTFALHDDEAWAMAQATNTVAGFQEYLRKEPGGIHAGEARYQMTALQRADAWKVTKNDMSPATLQAFLDRYPQGLESNEARRKLSALSYRVELADAPSKALAEHSRARLQARFGKVVHEVMVVPPSAPDTHYRVTSGPMSQADANSACAAVERMHHSCKLIQLPGTLS